MLADLLSFLNDNLVTISTLIIGLILGSLGTYFKSRIRNIALIADIKRLENEKQQVVKEHQLDLEKRKYRYESKKEQYSKFFHLLDSFTKNGNSQIKSRLLPIMSQYNQDFLEANLDPQKEELAISKYSDSLMQILTDATEDLLKIRFETNSIKLIAGEKIIEKINELENLYDKSTELSSQLLFEFRNAMMTDNYDKIHELNVVLIKNGSDIEKVKAELIEQMRVELDEI